MKRIQRCAICLLLVILLSAAPLSAFASAEPSSEASGEATAEPSGEASAETAYACAGKRLSILADSACAYPGYIPDGFETYYTPENMPDVNDTWWMRLLNETGMQLCVNNSCSGACLSTGARQDGYISACDPRRTGALCDEQGNPPDYIIIYAGVDDFLLHVPMGSYDGSGPLPDDTTTFREALAVLLHDLQENYPQAQIMMCTTVHGEITEWDDPVAIREGLTQDEFNDIIREIAALFDVEIIDMAACGINTENLDIYMEDHLQQRWFYDGIIAGGLHPNEAGQELMYLEALKHFS